MWTSMMEISLHSTTGLRIFRMLSVTKSRGRVFCLANSKRRNNVVETMGRRLGSKRYMDVWTVGDDKGDIYVCKRQ